MRKMERMSDIHATILVKQHVIHIRDKEITLHEQLRRVSNLAQGFIIR